MLAIAFMCMCINAVLLWCSLCGSVCGGLGRILFYHLSFRRCSLRPRRAAGRGRAAHVPTRQAVGCALRPRRGERPSLLLPVRGSRSVGGRCTRSARQRPRQTVGGSVPQSVRSCCPAAVIFSVLRRSRGFVCIHINALEILCFQ